MKHGCGLGAKCYLRTVEVSDLITPNYQKALQSIDRQYRLPLVTLTIAL